MSSSSSNPNPVLTPLGPLIWDPTSPYTITGVDFNVNSRIIVNPYADVVKFWSDLAKVCSNSETICEAESENCANCESGYLHSIYKLLSGNSGCKCKRHGKENIILHYLSMQISRLFK